VFKKEGGSRNAVYKHHCLPTGCILVEKNAEGRRVVDGWEIFYNGWSTFDDEVLEQAAIDKENEEGVLHDAVTINNTQTTDKNIQERSVEEDLESHHLSRNDTTKDDLFPESRLGCLVVDGYKSSE